jgi:hypothetical protein
MCSFVWKHVKTRAKPACVCVWVLCVCVCYRRRGTPTTSIAKSICTKHWQLWLSEIKSTKNCCRGTNARDGKFLLQCRQLAFLYCNCCWTRQREQEEVTVAVSILCYKSNFSLCSTICDRYKAFMQSYLIPIHCRTCNAAHHAMAWRAERRAERKAAKEASACAKMEGREAGRCAGWA